MANHTAKTNGSSPQYSWKFFRAGGFDQVNLTAGADLLNLDKLDQKLWMALSCPTRGLEFDTRTLDLIDTDKDGRIRAPEIIAAARWACACLKNPDDLLKGAASMPLAAINDATPEGRQLVASARQILDHLGKKGADAISVEDTTDTARIFAQTHFNGDGIIIPDAAGSDEVKAVMLDIIAAFGAETDRSGKPGLNQAKADKFFAEAQACLDWEAQSRKNPDVLPLKAATAEAAAAVRAVRAKVEDYFARCRVAAFDARAINALNRDEKDYLAITVKDLTAGSAEIAALPLSRIEPGRPLPLAEGVNPAWAAALARLQSAAIVPLLGAKTTLTEDDWVAVQGKLAAFEAWNSSQPASPVLKLGVSRLQAILAGKAREEIAPLIAKDKSLEPEFNAIAALDKLVRYHRDLYRLCINFVNFKDFYDLGEPAIFQAGTLYLDQRSCNLCLYVEDPGKHATMAGLAGSYLAYCDCVRKGTGEKMQIVAAFTGGDSENLMVGRNGIFYDRKGRDWDATITKIIDNPISIRQAFWSPYKKLVRMIEEQVAKRAASAESSANEKLSKTAEKVATADKAAPPAAPAKGPEPKRVDVGTVAALGVAIGSIGTAFGYFLKTVADIKDWQFPLLLIGLVMMISGPSMLIAYLKLRKRNLGPILDANGWAVNAKAKINVPFGSSLTAVAALPAGAQLDATDAFAEKRNVWPRLLVVLFFVWWAFAYLNTEHYLYYMTGEKFGKRPPNAIEESKPARKAAAAAAAATNATNAPAAPPAAEAKP